MEARSSTRANTPSATRSNTGTKMHSESGQAAQAKTAPSTAASAAPLTSLAISTKQLLPQENTCQSTPNLAHNKPAIHYSTSRQPTCRSTIGEPRSWRQNRNILHGDQRKAFRSLRALRDDLQRQHTDMLQPGSWLLRHIVANYFQPAEDYDWNTSLFLFLKHVQQLSQMPSSTRPQGAEKQPDKESAIFTQLHSQAPLFPTDEGFTLDHFKIFIYQCLKLLESQND
ncbi:hypothetical protein TDB9533_01658 [Thalassocella blandensis]|nr:hypothetical protein TDB9533_01658 [Thalassocella blandensis]